MRGKTEQKTSRVSRGETNTDVLCDGGPPGTHEIIFDHGVLTHIDTDLICTYGTLEGRPAAVADVAVVALNTGAVVQTGVAITLANAAFADAIQT